MGKIRTRAWTKQNDHENGGVHSQHTKNMTGPGPEQQQQHIAESAAQKWKDPPHSSQPYQDTYMQVFSFRRGFPFQMSLFKQPKFFPFVFHTFRRKKENKSLWSGTRPCSWWWHGRSRTECDSFSRQPITRAKGIEAYRLLNRWGIFTSSIQIDYSISFFYSKRFNKCCTRHIIFIPFPFFLSWLKLIRRGNFGWGDFRNPAHPFSLTARRHNRIDERENVLQDKIGLPVWTGVIDNDVLLLNLTQLFFKNKNLQENVDRFHIEKRKIPSRFCHPIRSDPIIFDRWSLCAIKTNILKSLREWEIRF